MNPVSALYIDRDSQVPRVSRDVYRNAMARLGAAVSIITTDGSAGRTGFTASAVCSVSDAPPTLLVCVNRASTAHGFLIKNRVLCVNALSAKSEDLSRLFSAKLQPTERFAAASWSSLQTGAPVLEGALVSFDCRVAATHCVGSHDVFYCEVTAIAHNEREDAALLYYNRQYHEVGRVLKTPGIDFEIIEWE
jgi:flavin reductase